MKAAGRRPIRRGAEPMEVVMPEPKHAEPDAPPDEDAELDEALEETFPASDPISPMQHRPSEERQP